jgi:DnaK suppressor protein
VDNAKELSPAEVSGLGKRLETLKVELQQTLSVRAQHARPVDLDAPIGRLSRMDAMQRQAMAQANLRSSAIRLEQVEGALIAIENDSYGDCRLCDEPIGFLRLSARPEAPFCLECQRSRS